jgi:hypothetical protein
MNNIQPAHIGKGLAGVERYGSVHDRNVEAKMPSFIGRPNTELAPPSGNPYLGKYQSCLVVRADGAQCKGPKAKGTDFCIGHLRSMEKAQKEQEEKPSE